MSASACLQDTTAQAVQGDLRLLEFRSEVFGNTRFLRIWLPPGYSDSTSSSRSYPVLYLNDGQDLFDSSTANYGSAEWQVDETLSRLMEEGEIPEMIAVGIDNGGRRGRMREYLPYPDEYLQPPEPDPVGSLYGEFLEAEVFPFVESRFRVRTDGAGRWLGGSSYGALIALHVAVSRPGILSRLLLESPSFYVDDDHVLRDAEEADLDLDRVYLGVGTNELGLDGCPEHPDNAAAVQGVQRLSQILLAGGMEAGQVRVNIEECAGHTQTAWARRFPAAVRFLAGG
ncbi:MAG: alpha/beta hydrolase-fold protein [Gemmatimonadota bacterium]